MTESAEPSRETREALRAASRWEETALKLSAACTEFRTDARRAQESLARHEHEFNRSIAEQAVYIAALEGSVKELKRQLVQQVEESFARAKRDREAAGDWDQDESYARAKRERDAARDRDRNG